MKILSLESTDQSVPIPEGTKYGRVWMGTTESGVLVALIVAGVGALADDPKGDSVQEELDAEERAFGGKGRYRRGSIYLNDVFRRASDVMTGIDKETPTGDIEK